MEKIDEISTTQAGKILKKSPGTVQGYIKAGKLPARKVNGCWLLPLKSVDRQLELPFQHNHKEL